MFKKTCLIIFITALFLGFAGSLSQAHAGARLYFDQTSYMATVGEELTVKVMVDAGEENITTVALRITYPSDKLTLSLPVGDSAPADSFVTNWTIKDTGTAGVIRYEGFKASPGVTGVNQVLRLVFTPDAVGSATISFDEDYCKVRRNDAAGTDILETRDDALVTIAVAGNDPTATPTTSSGGSGTLSTNTPTPTVPTTGAVETTIAALVFGVFLLFAGSHFLLRGFR